MSSLTDRLEHSGAAAPTTTSGVTAASAATIALTDGTGWPTGSIGKFVVTIARETANEERVLCLSRTGAVLTVDTGGRGFDGTVAREHQAATAIEHTWSTSEADAANAHSSSVAGHGVDVVVGTDEPQTLENKTLEDPVVNNPALAGGSITGSFSGAPTFTGDVVFSGNPDFNGQPGVTNFTQATHTHLNTAGGGQITLAAISDQAAYAAGVTAAIALKQSLSEKGAANGYGSLDATGFQPFSQVKYSGVQAVRNSVQGFADGNQELVSFNNADVYDTDTYHDVSGSPTRFTIPSTGIYDIVVQLAWEGNSTGRRICDVRLNDSSSDGSSGESIGKTNPTVGHGATYYQQVTVIGAQLTAGDTIKVLAMQNRGGALNLMGNTDEGTCSCTITRRA